MMIWVCLKIGYIPNEIAIFHRDNNNHQPLGLGVLTYFQTHPYFTMMVVYHGIPELLWIIHASYDSGYQLYSYGLFYFQTEPF